MQIYRTVNRGQKRQPPKPVILEASLEPHAKTVNYLAKDGKIKPASIRVHGRQYDFNSAWAATDWLKTQNLTDKGEHTWL